LFLKLMQPLEFLLPLLLQSFMVQALLVLLLLSESNLLKCFLLLLLSL
jgi:hypothetical protein